jgi:hypothetical protein
VSRLLLLGSVVGLLNGSVAAATLFAVDRAEAEDLTWFAYAPASSNVVYDTYGFPWAYVALPAVLLVLNALLVPLAVRRSWFTD